MQYIIIFVVASIWAVWAPATPEEIHVSKLWYYDFLLFLENQEVSWQSQSVQFILEDMPFSEEVWSIIMIIISQNIFIWLFKWTLNHIIIISMWSIWQCTLHWKTQHTCFTCLYKLHLFIRITRISLQRKQGAFKIWLFYFFSNNIMRAGFVEKNYWTQHKLYTNSILYKSRFMAVRKIRNWDLYF